MATYQKDVVAGLKKFAEWIHTWSSDTQVAIVSTESLQGDGGQGCFVGSKKILSISDPHFLKQFENQVRVGVTTRRESKVLATMEQALSSKMLNNTKCNKGFLRKGAILEVYVISATQDTSPKSIEYYIHSIKALQKSHGLLSIRVNVVGPSICTHDGLCPHEKSRYLRLSRLLKGVYVHIGRELFWQGLMPLCSMCGFGGLPSSFSLSRIPRPSTLSVSVNGQRVKKSAQDGWEYFSAYNTIYFSKFAQPPYDSQIDVRYRARTCGK